jgi:hypothetical protein
MLWWKPTGALSGGPTWSGSHIFDLVSLTEVYAGDDVTRLSRAEYQYDSGGLINNTGMWQHNNTYNQHAPEYDPATLYRGNITQVKRYADALTLDQGTAVVETRNYDIAGNVRARTTPCCDQTSFGEEDQSLLVEQTISFRSTSDRAAPIRRRRPDPRNNAV